MNDCQRVRGKIGCTWQYVTGCTDGGEIWRVGGDQTGVQSDMLRSSSYR